MRIPSSTVIDDASGSVETSGTFDRAQDAIDFNESLEGMRVMVNTPSRSGPGTSSARSPVVGVMDYSFGSFKLNVHSVRGCYG